MLRRCRTAVELLQLSWGGGGVGGVGGGGGNLIFSYIRRLGSFFGGFKILNFNIYLFFFGGGGGGSEK